MLPTAPHPRQHAKGLLRRREAGQVRKLRRPPNQFGVCDWDGKSVDTDWAFGAVRGSSRQRLQPRHHPRQHPKRLLHGCGAGQVHAGLGEQLFGIPPAISPLYANC